MKEKRYFYECIIFSNNVGGITKFLITVFFAILIIIGTMFNYKKMLKEHNDALEAYSESDYDYLDEIANDVIDEKYGIIISKIPEDVKYEIAKTDDVITFNYYIDNNKDIEFAVSAKMKITLSTTDYKILTKKPNYSLKEEYIKDRQLEFKITSFVLATVTFCVIGGIIYLCCVLGYMFSKMHEESDIKKSKEV